MTPETIREMILDEAEDMYVNQMMSIKTIVKTLRDSGKSITIWRLCDRLRNKGLNRTSTQTFVHKRSTEQINNVCAVSGCTNQCEGRQKHCRVCVPDGPAHMTYLRHGLTHPQVETILVKQERVCAGCKNIMIRGGTKTEMSSQCIDHNHATGEIRGILCRRCNTALGYAKDDPVILRRLAEYLESQGSYAPLK